VAAELHVLLADRELLAGSNENLLLHEIDAGDHLRHRMLDLEAWVDLEEVEAPVRREQELDGTRVRVVHGSGDDQGRVGDLFPKLFATAADGASSTTF